MRQAALAAVARAALPRPARCSTTIRRRTRASPITDCFRAARRGLRPADARLRPAPRRRRSTVAVMRRPGRCPLSLLVASRLPRMRAGSSARTGSPRAASAMGGRVHRVCRRCDRGVLQSGRARRGRAAGRWSAASSWSGRAATRRSPTTARAGRRRRRRWSRRCRPPGSSAGSGTTTSRRGSRSAPACSTRSAARSAFPKTGDAGARRDRGRRDRGHRRARRCGSAIGSASAARSGSASACSRSTRRCCRSTRISPRTASASRRGGARWSARPTRRGSAWSWRSPLRITTTGSGTVDVRFRAGAEQVRTIRCGRSRRRWAAAGRSRPRCGSPRRSTGPQWSQVATIAVRFPAVAGARPGLRRRLARQLGVPSRRRVRA